MKKINKDTQDGDKKKGRIMLVVLIVIACPLLFKKNASFLDIISFGQSYTRIATLSEKNKIKRYRFNLGWKHQRYVLFWLPLGGSINGEYVLYSEKRKGYIASSPVTHKEAVKFAKRENITLPPSGSSPINPYCLWWGWFIMIPLLCIGTFLWIKQNK